ncbi:MAG: hypothetical protein R3B13_37955 [Polyangiaceae bacterium]
MSETELFRVFTDRLNALRLEYMVTGSVAGTLYGEPRVTHDVDLVLRLPGKRVSELVLQFPIEAFYCPPEEIIVQELLRGQRGHFNLIHHETGFRADVYLVGRDPLHSWALSERRSIEVEGQPIWVAPAEYVIVRKLEFFREGGSEKHIRDIRGILEISSDLVRREIVELWVDRLGLAQAWGEVHRSE